MPARRRTFDEPIDDELIYWDSSFAIAFLSDAAQNHGQCRAFHQQVGTKQAVQHRTDLEARALRIAIPDTVTDRAFRLMQDFALLPTDAYHVATALESGVVTLDEDFLDVDGIIVYTCLQWDKFPTCRRSRRLTHHGIDRSETYPTNSDRQAICPTSPRRRPAQ